MANGKQKKATPKTEEGKICFVISPIGKPDSETRKRADNVLNNVIEPAVTNKGYIVKRADSEANSNSITPGIVKRLLESELVIADLSEPNPNVYYELAIRHTTMKPCIQIKEKKEQLPFDISDIRTHDFDLLDIATTGECIKTIIKCIEEFEKGDLEIINPVSTANTLIQFSNKEELEAIKQLFESITNDIGYLKSNIQSSFDSRESERRRNRRFHPMLIEELIHVGLKGTEPVAIIMLFSLFRENMPWMYELGLELYKAVKNNDNEEVERLTLLIKRAFEISRHSSMGEFEGGEMYIFLKQFPMLIERLSQRIIDTPNANND